MGLDSNAARSQHHPLLAGVAGSGSKRGRRVADRLRGAPQTLQAAYRRLAQASDVAADGSLAAAWLLENYYIVERAFRLRRDGCPAEFERRLPQVATGDL